MKPISIQLYTLREASAKDFAGVLKRLAAIGYKGVEPAGLYNFTPRDFRRMVEDLGMVVSSTHSPWAKPDNLPETIDMCKELGVDMVAGGWGGNEFKDMDAIKQTAEMAAGMEATLSKAGITLTVHNHAWEFEKLNGRIKHEIFAELCPKVKFELDTYWASNFGENNVVEMVRRFAHRSPLLHIKDGPLVRPVEVYNAATSTLELKPGAQSASLLAVGSGKNDIKGIIGAMDPAVTKWLVVEQDNSDTDMFECVERSYRYLIENKLAEGNRK
ncbi:MAG: sugar phosphate isomerase/epimerase [bacterium]